MDEAVTRGTAIFRVLCYVTVALLAVGIDRRVRDPGVCQLPSFTAPTRQNLPVAFEAPHKFHDL